MKTAAAGPQAIENNFTTMLHLNPSYLRHLSIQSLRFETQPDTFSKLCCNEQIFLSANCLPHPGVEALRPISGASRQQ